MLTPARLECTGRRRGAWCRKAELNGRADSETQGSHPNLAVNPFRINVCRPPVSVASKELTAILSLLDATLTKTRGGQGCAPSQPSGLREKQKARKLWLPGLLNFELSAELQLRVQE